MLKECLDNNGKKAFFLTSIWQYPQLLNDKIIVAKRDY